MNIVALADLRAGSFVKISTRFGVGSYIAKIVRETPSQLVTSDNAHFYKKDGYRVGDGYYHRASIICGSDGVVSEVEAAQCEANIAERKRLDELREHCEDVQRYSRVNIAAKLGLREDRVKVEYSSKDGFATPARWTVELSGLDEADVKRIQVLQLKEGA